MLELHDVSLFVGRGESLQPILADVDLRLPRQHLAAVIGPSGCGKSTLLKVVAGIADGDDEGRVIWDGRDLSEQDFAPTEVGYVPQFGIAHDELTTTESILAAVRLRVRPAHPGHLREIAEQTLAEVGLGEFGDRRVGVLSGGQKRRLALAMEIASAPAILLCDEVTSGLDAQAEDGIVHLIHRLATRDRLVLSVTHSLRHLDLYDSIIVLAEGSIAYHGRPGDLTHYFQIGDPEELYARLSERKGHDWSRSWRKHHAPYTEDLLIEFAPAPAESTEESYAPRDADKTNSPGVFDDFDATTDNDEFKTPPSEESRDPEAPPAGNDPKPEIQNPKSRIPSAFSQFTTLVERRFRIFFRSPGQIALQLGLILGFPVLVAIFAWHGLPEIQNLSVGLGQDPTRQLVEANSFLAQASRIGSLVSGIVMFQVILLTLMGANNSGREIAAERLIFEKEKLSGLRATSYIASKAVFLSLLVLAQSIWMGLFVHFVCGFPGDLLAQLGFLVLVNAAMTSICLGVSAWMSSAEQASLVSIYLVGFQLPLSGAVLALPDAVGSLVRPFISAYWSWSGVLQTLRGERYYEIAQMVVQTALSPAALCAWILVGHILAGLFLAYTGSKSTRFQ
ncbi:MAG: ATP-binding cassette domain-containing protein [Chthoniobacterales bacterium]